MSIRKGASVLRITYGSMGTKYVENTKGWSKLKNGTFGYVYRKKTTYVCRSSRVAKSNNGNQTRDGQYQRVAESNRDDFGDGCKLTTKKSIEALGGNSMSINRGAAFRLITNNSLITFLFL